MAGPNQNIERLKALLPGKVKTSKEALLAYSTDAGLYKIIPRAVVVVEKEGDIAKVLEFSRSTGIPVTPRAAGSSCVGGAIGAGIVLSFTRFDKVLGFDPEKSEVRVQPGIIYQDLNRYLARHGLMFAPDPASGDFCRLGGMLANNASGPQSIKYGTTKDYVRELKVYLPDGRKITAKKYKVKSMEFKDALKNDPFLKGIHSLVSENRGILIENAPGVRKNASGYNLFDLALGLEKGEFDYTRLFVGSEGTLGIIAEATLALVPVPRKKVTALIYLNDLNQAGAVVEKLLPLGPSAIEILEKNAMDVLGRAKFDIPEKAEAMLLLEFNEGDLEEKVGHARRILTGFKLSRAVDVAFDAGKQALLWRARKAALPALSKYDPRKKPMPFVEDGIVPTEKVPEYIRFLDKLFASHGIKVGAYGHIGDGNTHIRPLMDINDKRDLELLPVIARKIHGKVKELGGTLTGEHGDGRTLTPFLEEHFGPKVYGLMKDAKRLFDPGGIMNPDVIISKRSLTDDIDFEKYQWDCGTCGKCNPYCPVFVVTGAEEQSPRGLFRIVTSGDYSWDDARELVEGCLDCRLCSLICPAGAKPAELVLEERARHPHPAAARFDNRCEGFSCGMIRMLAPGRMRRTPFSDADPSIYGNVAYFYGCAANFLDENIPEDALELLEEARVDVAVPEQLCCGASFYHFGDEAKAKELARFNLESLSRFEKVVTTCPHCAQFIKEYPKLFSREQERRRAKELSGKVVDLSELLDPKKLRRGSGEKVVYQEPCYARLAGSKRPVELLRKVSDLVEPEQGCCGASLGYQIRNRKMADAIRKKREEALEACGADTIVTTCPYCLIHLKNGGSKKVKHLAGYLKDKAR